MVPGDPRGTARNGIQNLTTLQWLQWLTMRSIATEWMLSVDPNENVSSLSSLFRSCIRIRVDSLVGRKGEFN